MAHICVNALTEILSLKKAGNMKAVCLMLMVFAATCFGGRYRKDSGVVCQNMNCLDCPKIPPNCVATQQCGGCCKVCSKTKFTFHSSVNMFEADTNSYMKCMKDQCYCVYEGKRLLNYSVFPKNMAGKYACKCAYDKEKDHRMGIVGKEYGCTKPGAYGQIRCKGSKCYCLTPDGKTFGSPHSVSELQKSKDKLCIKKYVSYVMRMWYW